MKKTLLTMAITLCFTASFSQVVQDTTVRTDHYGQVVDRVPVTAESRNGILVFESKDQLYRLWFDIRVQTDGQIFLGKTLNPIGNGVTIRRARFATKTNLGKNWYGEIDLDFANGAIELKDAYLSYNFLNGFTTRVGNYKERFSMSESTTSRYLKLIERAMVVSAFAPSRHIGLETEYNGDKFLVAGGIFFQEVKDAETNTFVEDNNKDYGRNQGISLTGKFVFQPFGNNKDHGVHLAYGYSYRQPKTDVAPAEYDNIRYSARSLSSINRKKYLDTDLIPGYKYQLLSNIEFAAYLKGLAIQTEIINNRTKRDNNLPTLNFGGYYAQAVYLLFGGKQVYDKSGGEFTQPVRGKKWGDVELAVRYDYINLNDKDVYGGAAEAFTGGVNFYTSRNIKFQVNFSNINHDRYASGKNKLFVGYDVNGVLTKDPTKVADASGKAGEKYNQLGVRFEIDF